MESEKNWFVDSFSEAQKRHRDSAQAQTGEVRKKKPEAELALKKTVKKKNHVVCS